MTRVPILLLTACAATPVPIESAEPPTESIPEYDRQEWGRWMDADKDCQDTRQEVLVAESEVEVTFKDGKTCAVESGQWTCAFTGKVITNPGGLDIDHMIPLREAHLSGGHAWDSDAKQKFTNTLNDPDHLIAVSASANRSKGARAPHEWLPPLETYRCEYVRIWIKLKEKWELQMDECEQSSIDYLLKICGAGLVPPLPQE